jgi:TatD DNase family protein
VAVQNQTKQAIIETHAHLTDPRFKDDLDAVISRALEAGVEYIVNVGYDLENSRKSVELAAKYDCCYAAAGIHPHDAKEVDDRALAELESLARESKVVALGEIGLDFYRDRSPRDAQKAAFRRQLELAEKLGLPVIVHDRDAHAETMEILDQVKPKKAVLHCFAGDAAMAREVVGRGWLVSVAGPVTYRNSKHLPEAVKAVSAEGLMLETDCPYLPPEPHRGARSEPAHLPLIAQRVSELLLPLTYQDICRVTTVNAKAFFGIGQIDPAAIAYPIRSSLYLNLTNRCTNACTFCIRQKTDFIKGHNLRLNREPGFGEVISAIGDPTRYQEVVFCGYGEPLLRLELVVQVAKWLKERGASVRLNTNGQGNLIHGRNIVPELKGLVDEASVSLNAHDRETYGRICPSQYGDRAYGEVISFISECKKAGIKTAFTVLDMPGVDLAACRELAKSLGVGIRVRHYDVVG